MPELTCDFCGRSLKNATGKTLHEQSCAKNPAASAKAPKSPKQKPKPFGTPQEESLVALLYAELKELRKEVADMKQRDQEAARVTLDPLAVPELAGIMSVPVEQRAERLVEILSKLTPEQQAKRQAAIMAAYKALPPDPAPTAELRPGTYVESGTDASKAPTFSKVKYTKEWMEAHYPMVDLAVMVDTHGPIQFADVKYDVKQGGMYKVPSIIKDIYDWYVQNLKVIEWRYQPITMQEDWDLTQRAKLTNQRQWSRVHRTGVGIMPAEVIGAPAPAPETNA